MTDGGVIMTETKLTIRMPKELRNKAKEKAKKEDTTISRKIRQVLREWVEDPPKENEEP
jgi:predicted HicB family RNase H-like nuclease